MGLDILIVDDEEDIRELVAGILSDEGYETRTASDSDTALGEITARRPALLVLDIWLQGSKLDGLEILDIVKKRFPDVPVIIISGHGNVETAVAAIKRGAYDFIEKPFKADQLVLMVERATEAERLRRENEELKALAGFDLELTGTSSCINQVRQMLKKVAPTNSRVLISGAPGSGKEVAARILHQWSPRSTGPFVVVNAASISPDRMEEELFGVEENGSIARVGLFERAHGGTLFLDEVADMPVTTQAKILRVLTDQHFERVNGSHKVAVNLRLISTTSKDLHDQISLGRFREDLFHRLNVVPIKIPALKERREDIPQLITFFLKRMSQTKRARALGVSQDAMAALQTYDWPGNVRQLKNIVERILILAGDEVNEFTAESLPAELSNETARMVSGESASIMASPLREAREAFEREYLRVQINRFSGNISRTAAFIGMERSALHRKLKSLGLTGDKRTKQPAEAASE